MTEEETLGATAGARSSSVTHGRHCTCSACAREDWTRITGPCGMHGYKCPASYQPLGAPGSKPAHQPDTSEGGE